MQDYPGPGHHRSWAASPAWFSFLQLHSSPIPSEIQSDSLPPRVQALLCTRVSLQVSEFPLSLCCHSAPRCGQVSSRVEGWRHRSVEGASDFPGCLGRVLGLHPPQSPLSLADAAYLSLVQKHWPSTRFLLESHHKDAYENV